jgi:hypothetical protein
MIIAEIANQTKQKEYSSPTYSKCDNVIGCPPAAVGFDLFARLEFT